MIKFVKVLITIGSAILSFGYMMVWIAIFAFTGVLMMIDFLHKVWTGRRINWIAKAMGTWSNMFANPFPF